MFTRTHPLRRCADARQPLLAKADPNLSSGSMTQVSHADVPGQFHSPELLLAAAAGVRVRDSGLTASKRAFRSRADGKRSRHITPRRRFLFLCCRRVGACMRARACLFACACTQASGAGGKAPAPSAHALQVRPELRAPRCAASLGIHGQKCMCAPGGVLSTRACWLLWDASPRPLSPRLIYAGSFMTLLPSVHQGGGSDLCFGRRPEADPEG